MGLFCIIITNMLMDIIENKIKGALKIFILMIIAFPIIITIWILWNVDPLHFNSILKIILLVYPVEFSAGSMVIMKICSLGKEKNNFSFFNDLGCDLPIYVVVSINFCVWYCNDWSLWANLLTCGVFRK